MGTNCSTLIYPDTTNLCYTSVNNFSPTMPNFCTILGPGGNTYRDEFCGLMSKSGEWGNPVTVTNSCSYDDFIPYQDFNGGGCCNGPCGIVGGGLSCERLSFTGDPITCCFNNLECESPGGNPPLCYSDINRQQTCSNGANGQPNHRNLTSIDCQEVLIPYCTGTLPTDDPTSTDWLNRWTTSDIRSSCSYALFKNLFRGIPCLPNIPIPPPGKCGLPPPLPIDSEGFFWGQRLIEAAMVKYKSQGFDIGALPGFPGYNTWQDFMYTNVCCPYPGLCQNALQTICSDKTAQRISLNPNVAKWCGCHLPPGEYEDYSVKFNIPPECTPTCNRIGTIPIVGINATPVSCKQNICLIDGVTINLINSQIGGGIDFDQICGNCVGAQCSCIVSDTSVDIINSTIGGNLVPIAEGCGAISCSQTNPASTGPATLNVPCQGTGTFNPYAQYEIVVAAEKKEAEKKAWLWTLIAISISLFLVYLIIYFVHPIVGGSSPQ